MNCNNNLRKKVKSNHNGPHGFSAGEKEEKGEPTAHGRMASNKKERIKD
jgi:hypothetical protein